MAGRSGIWVGRAFPKLNERPSKEIIIRCDYRIRRLFPLALVFRRKAPSEKPAAAPFDQARNDFTRYLAKLPPASVQWRTAENTKSKRPMPTILLCAIRKASVDIA